MLNKSIEILLVQSEIFSTKNYSGMPATEQKEQANQSWRLSRHSFISDGVGGGLEFTSKF